MSNLIYYNPQKVGIVINNSNGDIFATQEGYQVLSKKSKQTVTRCCQKYDLRYTRPGNIVDATTGDLIDDYYLILIPSHLVLRWLIHHNLEEALVMGCKGAAVYLYGLAGFKARIKLTASSDNKPLIDYPDKR